MTKILIVEDILETQIWLSEIASAAFDQCEIDMVASVKAATLAINQNDYDIALIDIGLPDGSGLDVLRKLKSRNPDIICIVTTVMGDDAHIVAALSAGAQGYLLKEQDADMLVKQLKQVSSGVPALSPSIARRIMTHFRLTGPVAEPDGNLTFREQEVLALIGKGMRNIDVANDLGLAVTTVASHIKSIYRKLGISSRAEASWHASQIGFTDISTAKE